MSSGAYLTIDHLDGPVGINEWQQFCAEHAITYSPQTVGRNVYYADDVEIHFGHARNVLLPADGPDFAPPLPEFAYKITVSAYFMGNTEAVARMAAAIWKRWPQARLACSPEVQKHFLQGLVDD